MEALFAEDEIRTALLEAEGDQVSGPNRFPFSLPGHFWTFFGRIFLFSSRRFTTRMIGPQILEILYFYYFEESETSIINDFQLITLLG